MLRYTFTIDGSLRVPPVGSCLPPLSQDIEMHFSLDMAQQLQVAKFSGNLRTGYARATAGVTCAQYTSIHLVT